MIEIIKNAREPDKIVTSLEVVHFQVGKAYAIFKNNVAVKWLFFVNEDGTLERF